MLRAWRGDLERLAEELTREREFSKSNFLSARGLLSVGSSQFLVHNRSLVYTVTPLVERKYSNQGVGPQPSPQAAVIFLSKS